MRLANAINLNRKSGVAERRDLRFRGPLVETQNTKRKQNSAISPKPPLFLSGVVSGHDFSRAINPSKEEGFSPCISSLPVRKVN
jgi:hypothetical protein